MTKQVVNRKVIRIIREPLTPLRRVNFQLLLLSIKIKLYIKKDAGVTWYTNITCRQP
jgi:hypothetical protein